jgi:RimJ/RimL family protein N-acetyltransferase
MAPCRAHARQVEERDWLMSSERLRFGIWREDDGALATAIWGDPRVTALTGGPFTAEQIAGRLAAEIENWRQYGMQYWPMFRSDDGTLAGCCGLRPREPDAGVAELGFQLRRDAWGQGLATEAAKAVIAWARGRGFAALVAGHHPLNHASRRTLLGLGFSYTHDEFYAPTGQMEPCYHLPIGGCAP